MKQHRMVVTIVIPGEGRPDAEAFCQELSTRFPGASVSIRTETWHVTSGEQYPEDELRPSFRIEAGPFTGMSLTGLPERFWPHLRQQGPAAGSATAERPSTRLGNGLGAAMRAAAYAFDYVLPLAAFGAYRLIPDRWRGRMFGGPSASLAAIAGLRMAGGGGWQIIRAAASNHPPRPK